VQETLRVSGRTIVLDIGRCETSVYSNTYAVDAGTINSLPLVKQVLGDIVPIDVLKILQEKTI